MGTTHQRRRATGTAAGAVAGLLVIGAWTAAASPASAQDGDGSEATSQVSVVHGIPGQEVDVYADGEALLEGFAPGEVAGPLELPAGSYDLVITAVGGDPDSEPILSVEGAEVPGGENLSLVAHLDEDGEPTLTPFVNDAGALEAGEARITARHTAAAPGVDVRADEEVVFDEVSNPDEATAEVQAGTINADVVLAGTDTVVLGPADLELAEGTATIVYAIGSADDDTLELVVQTVDGLHSAPESVPSGTGGLAEPGVAGWAMGLTAAGALLLAGGGLLRFRIRRETR